MGRLDRFGNMCISKINVFKTTDSYGRSLLYIDYPNGEDWKDLSAEIIRQGCGHAFIKYPFDINRMKYYLRLEREAYQAQQGIWAPDTCNVSPKTEQNDTVIVYITPTGCCYHHKNCRMLTKSQNSIKVTRAQAKRHGRRACKVCRP